MVKGVLVLYRWRRLENYYKGGMIRGYKSWLGDVSLGAS